MHRDGSGAMHTVSLDDELTHRQSLRPLEIQDSRDEAHRMENGNQGHTYSKPSLKERLVQADRAQVVGWMCMAIAALVILVVLLSAFLGYVESTKMGWHLPGSQAVRVDESSPLYASFLVVGDWGRAGGNNQSEVATFMGRVADDLKPDFIISTGDNFYPSGLQSPMDTQFDTSFKNVYTAKSLQVPWYSVLGNHDYGDGIDGTSLPPCPADDVCFPSPLHEFDLDLRNRDPRWNLQRNYDLVLADGKVQIFFIDTNPFVTRYYEKSWAENKGGLTVQTWEANLRELESNLMASTAQWKIVVGHHPVYTNGEHGNTTELVTHLNPLLQRYGVQTYFCGHDHDLEYLRENGSSTHFIVSGAGSRCNRDFTGKDLSIFQYLYSGFVACKLRETSMVCDFHNIWDESLAPMARAVVHVNATEESRQKAIQYEYTDSVP